MRRAPHTNGMNILPGRATPAQTLPPGEGQGKPGFPLPLREGYARPTPPAGGDVGKPGFPLPLREGCARPNPPASGDVGKPGFPTPLLRAYVCAVLPTLAGPLTVTNSYVIL